MYMRFTLKLAFTNWKMKNHHLTIKFVTILINYLIHNVDRHGHLQKRFAEKMFAYLSGSLIENKRDVAIIKVTKVFLLLLFRISLYHLPNLGKTSFSSQ